MKRVRKAAEQDKRHPEREKPGKQAPEEGLDEGCRCKEVAGKTPRELFRFALGDLAFWKKAKKRK